MSNEDELSRLAFEYLEEADIDLISAKHLNENELTRKRAVFHLQQACEKALKAYFISTFVSVLTFFSKSQTSNRRKFQKSYQIIAKSRNFTKPKSFGHPMTSFFEYTNQVSKDFTEGKMREYIIDIVQQYIDKIHQNREKIIARIQNNEKIDSKQAEDVLNSMLKSMEFIMNWLRDFKFEYREIKSEKGEITEPCLFSCANFLLDSESKIRDAIKVQTDNLVLPDEAKMIIETLSRVYPETKELRSIVTGRTKAYIEDYLLPILALPLHRCLLKYEQGSRYPDAQQPTSADMTVIPLCLEALQHLVASVRRASDVNFGTR